MLGEVKIIDKSSGQSCILGILLRQVWCVHGAYHWLVARGKYAQN